MRVINNHNRQVNVYVVDSDDRLRLLGTVGRFGFKELQIPDGLTRGIGTVQLKVYPDLLEPGLTVTAFETAGIKSRPLSARSDQVIELWLEPDLTLSQVGVASS